MVDWLNVKNIPVIEIKKDRGKKIEALKEPITQDHHGHGLVVVDEANQLIFVRIPKNASSSIYIAMGKKEIQLKQEKINDPSFFKIAVFRDPLNRFVSGIWEIYGKKISASKLLTTDEIRLIVSEIKNHPWEEINPHLRLQSWFLKGLDINQILRFEHLEKDWAILNMPSLPRINPKPKIYTRLEISICEDKDLTQEIKDLYAEDYKWIGGHLQPNL